MVELELRDSKGFPIPYHELVPKTQASDEGDVARVGLGMNFSSIYVWMNDEMHILRMKDLINAIIPHLLPEHYQLTEAGKALAKKSEVAK